MHQNSVRTECPHVIFISIVVIRYYGIYRIISYQTYITPCSRNNQFFTIYARLYFYDTTLLLVYKN